MTAMFDAAEPGVRVIVNDGDPNTLDAALDAL